MINIYPPIYRTKEYGVRLVQGFCENPAIYQERLGIPSHNGHDLVLAFEPEATYGQPARCCFPEATIHRWQYESPFSSRGNAVWIITEPSRALWGRYAQKTIRLEACYFHLAYLKEGIAGKTIRAGKVLGTIGNSGWVEPKPTPDKPFNGTHLHWMLRPWILSESNQWEFDPEFKDYDGWINPTVLIGTDWDNFYNGNRAFQQKGLLEFLLSLFYGLIGLKK